MKKRLIVMNPCAGQKQANRYLADIVSAFTAAGYMCTVLTTGRKGDGKRLVEQHAARFDDIVCIGGDGTFNEVISGLLQAGLSMPVGYIPAGSTNDFARSLSLARHIPTAAKEIVAGTTRMLDIGRFNGRPFTYVASFGAFSETSYTAQQSIKNSIGHLAYVLEGIKDISAIRPHHLRFCTETDVYEGDYIFGAICNSTSVGGLLKLNPQRVDMNDGLFEVLLIRSPENAGQLAQILWNINDQAYEKCPQITFFSASRMTVEAPAGMAWSLDGEFESGAQTITIENQHSAITLMVPKKS